MPVFNEEENVLRAYNAITGVFAKLEGVDYEIIFTDNHSNDRTWPLLGEVCGRDPKVRAVRFSRNFGYQRSVLVAYKAANGACAIQIDCDLQDPPDLIPRMIGLWREGNEVVYGVRTALPDGWLVATARRAFYRLVNALSEDDLPHDAGEFRLVDRRVLDELRKVDDTTPYLRGLISALGFRQVGFSYERKARVAGESKFPLRAMIGLALDGILNHSLVPLRVASMTSFVVGLVTLFVIAGYIVGRLVFGTEWPAGFATTTVLILASITLNAMFLGIIGEYLGRIYMQSKRRPTPVIEGVLNRPPGATDAAWPDALLRGIA